LEFLPTVVPAPLAASPRLTAIGKYPVLDLLGQGGQGDVYRALHPTLGKEVVIKLARWPCDLADPDRGRLIAEGKVLAELNHPHLARVHDLDFHEGCPFLVMEYVHGRTLHSYASEQRLSPRRAATVVAALARALAIAHRRGIVHQDLKPRNVLIDDAGQPRIIDFGMARLVHGWADPRLQPEGGTAAYMAPEQARGETDHINPRTDLFALGGILYFLLTGHAPIRGRDRLEELDRARNCDFDRSALRTAKVPRRLEAICLRAMAAKPADRFARAEDLASALERFASRRRRLMLTITALALAVLAWPAWKGWMAWNRPADAVNPPPVVTLPENALSLRLWRDNRPRELKNAQALANVVPLRTGDGVKIKVKVPPGMYASLFWIDSSGNLAPLADGVPGDVLSYPSGASEFKWLEGPAGTEAVLVCWHRSGNLTVDELRTMWGIGETWPKLPKESVLHVDNQGVKDVQPSRSLGRSVYHSDPVGDVQVALDRLRLKLSNRVDFLDGIAFAHEDSSSSP
jgi:serine/threonine protein kinase